MDKSVLIDTNLYLDDANINYKLLNKYSKILIPLTVLKELDKHKYNKDLAYSARGAIWSILRFMKDYPDKVIFDVVNDRSISSSDEKILDAATRHQSAIATKDISMSIQADSKGLEVELHDIVLTNIFDPYIHLHMDEIFEAILEK